MPSRGSNARPLSTKTRQVVPRVQATRTRPKAAPSVARPGSNPPPNGMSPEDSIRHRGTTTALTSNVARCSCACAAPPRSRWRGRQGKFEGFAQSKSSRQRAFRFGKSGGQEALDRRRRWYGLNLPVCCGPVFAVQRSVNPYKRNGDCSSQGRRAQSQSLQGKRRRQLPGLRQR